MNKMATIIENVRVSLISFLSGSSVLWLLLAVSIGGRISHFVGQFWWSLIFLHCVLVNAVLAVKYRGPSYQVSTAGTLFQVAVRGALLGSGFGLGLILSFSDSTWRHFGWYLTALCFFHWSEYCVTGLTNPKNLSLDSYLLDHSREYHIAALASWVEFTVEWFIFPAMKQVWWISTPGLIIVLGGELLRKLAMFTAMTNFNHYVRHVKEDGHELVTDGVYGFCRHPSYVGWFYWSIGTQVILANPVCLVGYAWASWRFFKSRIEDEEITLLNFFGESYLDYQKRVKTGLPFIEGYRMEL